MDGAYVQLALQVILTALGTMALLVFQRLAGDVKSLTKSVEDLNIKMAVVVTQQAAYHERLDRIEKDFEERKLSWIK